MWLGGAASAVLLSVGCGRLEPTGGRSQNEPPRTFFGNIDRDAPGGDMAQFQGARDRGYNGTIQDIGSSIDPRTPELEGTPGRTLMTDITGYMGRPDIVQGYLEPPTSLGIGGSGAVDPASGSNDLGWRSLRDSVPASLQRGQYQGSGVQPGGAGSGTE
jgi:hypothetical protein